MTQQHLDSRAGESLQLLAYTSGALPDPAAAPISRQSLLRAQPHTKPLTGDAAVLSCAVCRVAVHELQLAAALVARCGQVSEGASLLLTRSASVLCDHMEARGLLGHTARTVQQTRRFCDVPVRASRRALSRLLTDPFSVSEMDLASPVCTAACNATLGHRPIGELKGWPMAVQLLLDQDGACAPPQFHAVHGSEV